MDDKILSTIGWSRGRHSAFQVRTGMMIGATKFFEDIGWFEFSDLRVAGEWGQARFVSSPGEMHLYQLTELSGGDPDKLVMTENHIAVHFAIGTPQLAAETLLDWANRVGASEGASIEPANFEGTKWFVYIPALFTFGIEIV